MSLHAFQHPISSSFSSHPLLLHIAVKQKRNNDDEEGEQMSAGKTLDNIFSMNVCVYYTQCNRKRCFKPLHDLENEK